MLVDCGTCAVRGVACDDCVLTVLWGLPDDETDGGVDGGIGRGSVPPVTPVRLGVEERRALRVLADAGLAPRLQHVEGDRHAG